MKPCETADTRAWILHPDTSDAAAARTPEMMLEESISLASALPRLSIAGSEVIRLQRTHPGFLFGKGKVDGLKAQFGDAHVDLVLIDGPVTPVQQRNLEKAWGVKILDRTGLILEIFSDRARTREGEMQVEMAALSYQRTRLVRAWTHLERQRGGLGFVGGPGETQIEADRRAIDKQIAQLKRQLEKVARTLRLHRSARKRSPNPVVALVGYTNAGKSTFFNRLTGANTIAMDMLFATLDPTLRSVALPSGQKIILSDTVGFISELPTQLIAAFRATLEEVHEADLILHVRDMSHPEAESQARDVEAILSDIGVPETTPRLEIWNKMDLVDDISAAQVLAQASRRNDVIPFSARTGEGVQDMLAAISDALYEDMTEARLFLPFTEGKARAWLHSEGVVSAEKQIEDGFRLIVRWSARQASSFAGMAPAEARIS